MKYKLKKDLPFVKAGELLSFTEQTICIHTHRTFKYYFDRSELQNLISEGWIEEVKPREIWINLYENNQYGQAHLTKNEAISIGGGNKRIIKFREVLDV